MDQIETKLPEINGIVNTNVNNFNTLLATSNQLKQRITTFNEGTRSIYNTTNKLRYAYNSADGLQEKLASVEAVMEGIQSRMSGLNDRLKVVEKTKLRYKLERRYRIRWLIMVGISLCGGLLYLFRHLQRNKREYLDLGGLESELF